MKKTNLLTFLLILSISSYAQIDFADNSKEPKVKPIPYDSTFIDYSNLMLTTEQKAGVVGEKITLIKVYTVKNEDGSDVKYSDSKKFENKTFEVIEYNFKYKDKLKIQNEDGIFLFEPSLLDEYVFNGFITKIKERLENKVFIPLKIKSSFESLKGDEIEIDGLKEYQITKVTLSKLSLGLGIVVEINNEFEVVYPNGYFDQRKENGWMNLESSNILKTKLTFIEKSHYTKFSNANKLYLNKIRNSEVKIGMSEKQCRYSFGRPTSLMTNIAGYDKVLIYGSVGKSQSLYFKNDILKLIK
jgi:hypothetical protein